MHCFFCTVSASYHLDSFILGAAADARSESKSDEETDGGDDENSGEAGEVGRPLGSNSLNAGGGGGTVLSVVKVNVEVGGVAEARAAKLSLQEFDGLESVLGGGGGVSDPVVVNEALVVLGEGNIITVGVVVVGVTGNVNTDGGPLLRGISDSSAARALRGSAHVVIDLGVNHGVNFVDSLEVLLESFIGLLIGVSVSSTVHLENTISRGEGGTTNSDGNNKSNNEQKEGANTNGAGTRLLAPLEADAPGDGAEETESTSNDAEKNEHAGK